MRFTLGLVLALALGGACAAETIHVDLPPPAVVPVLESGVRPAPVSFTRMAASLAEGQGFADVGAGYVACKGDGKILRWKSQFNRFDDPDFERIFRAEFAKAGLSVSGDRTNLFEVDTKAGDLQVGALVTDIRARICGTTLASKLSGMAVMSVDWQLYSVSAGKIVARIPSRGGVAGIKVDSIGDALVSLVQETFAENVRQLAANPQFRTIVLSPRPSSAFTTPPTETPLRVSFPAASKPIAIKDAAAGAVVVFAGSGLGSGVLISPDGYILTNHHVAGESGRVRIRWSDGSESVGEVVRVDRRRDVALIKVAAPRGRALPIRRAPAELGETVYAIGTPLESSLQNTVTKGVVSGMRLMDGESFIQSDAPITHGNSGGPLLDDKGAVVGLADLGTDPALGSTINFFIPIGDALKVLALQPAS